MPSLYRRSGSPFWWSSFYLAEKQVRFSTKRTNKKEALTAAIAFEDSQTQDRLGVPATAAHVSKLIRKAVERVAPESLKVLSVEEHLKQWLARKEKGTKKATFDSYRPVVANFLASLGQRAQIPLPALTLDDVQAFVLARLEKGTSAQTVRHNIKVLSDAFTKAVRAGLMERNPAASVEVPDAAPEKRQPLTPQEIQSLLQEAKGTEWETMILLGAYLGCRMGDAAAMKWSNVDLSAKTITWVPEKTSRKRKDNHTLPLPEPLALHLEELAGRNGEQVNPYVSPTLATVAVSGCSGLSRRFAELMRKAGVDSDQVVLASGRKFSSKSFHSLRHTAATELYRQGVASEDRMKILAHTSSDIHAGYTHQETQQLRKAMEKLPDYRSSKTPAQR